MKILKLGCVVLALVCAASASARPGYEMNVPAAGARAIEFDVQEGDFVVRGDPAATEVRMRVSVDRYWLFKLGEQDILKKLITVSGQGTEKLTIATDIQQSWRNWGRAEYPIDFEIVVPAGVLLQVRDTSGTIVVSEMQGAVNVHDGSGTLDIVHVAGPVNVQKESGDIRLSDIRGATTIDSKSGQMQLQRLGELRVDQSDGNLDISDVASAQVVNRGGNIRVRGVRHALSIDDDSGEIELSDVGGAVTIRDTSGQIRAQRTGAITINDTSGDIVVNRVASLDVVAKESGQVKVSNTTGAVRVPPGITLNRR